MNTLNGIEAIRVKVTLEDDSNGGLRDIRRFAFDPNITTFIDLYKLLQRAFQSRRHLKVSYRLPQVGKDGTCFSITSDRDLREAVFSSLHSPFLKLNVRVTGDELAKDPEEWIVLDGCDIPEIKDIRAFGSRLAIPSASALRKRVGNTLHQITSAFIDMSRKTPLGEADWSAHLDYEGHVLNPQELWVIVFNWGVEQSLRKQIWKHLLNVFPPDLTEMERDQYLMMKSKVYWHIRSLWQRPEELAKTESLRDMVWKDVRRTDRTYPYYDVPDEHAHLISLFNVLVTYAVLNPDVSYAQGMSDLAAPLMVVMDDEAITFTCFSALMNRCKGHFLPDGKAMSLKFDHLSLLVQKMDPVLYKYLVKVEADDMFFCYRWLVLDLKREFQFDDTLRVMEVIWSSLLPPPPNDAPQTSSGPTFNTVSQRCDNSTAVLRSEGYTSLPYSYQSLIISANNEEDYEDEDECSALNINDFDGKLELVSLPDPYHLGDGNPFSLFLCLAILILHRDQMLQEQDYNSLASSFDKLVRKHDPDKVLNKARELYSRYLRHCEVVDNNEFVPLQKDTRTQRRNDSWFDDGSCEFIQSDSQVVQC